MSQVKNFNDTLNDVSLSDLGYLSYKFIWTNRWKKPNNIQECLDRVVDDAQWRSWRKEMLGVPSVQIRVGPLLDLCLILGAKKEEEKKGKHLSF